MYPLKRLWLDKDAAMRAKWSELLQQGGLSANETVDYTVGIFHEDTLIATGSLLGNIIKCVIVCQKYQQENLLTQVMTALQERLREENQLHSFVYTKPKNEIFFQSLGFKKIVATQNVLFMEQGSPDFKSYLEKLQALRQSGANAAIVMNANPFTKGHRYLVETAAAENDHVYVFVLSEDRSLFSTEDRVAMVKAGVADLANVTVLETADYLVSSSTFPDYFLKEHADLAKAKEQATLDATLFKEKIVPVLNITRRYVGSEPLSPVTEVYNQAMAAVFQGSPVLKILPRKEINGGVISATKVRQAMKEENLELLQSLLPPTTFDYMKNQNKI